MSSNRILAIDVNIAGCAGDMLIAGLLGQVNSPDSVLSKLSNVFSEILGTIVNISYSHKQYDDIKGSHLNIDEVIQLDYQRIRKFIPHSCDLLGMNHVSRENCVKVFDLLLAAEREVHGVEEVHLHELGTSDTLIDIVTSFYLIENLHISEIQISSIATGSGTIQTSHGILSVPTPVTQKIFELSKLVTCLGPSDGEATTPTGAAILAILKTQFERPESATWEQSSFGFGTRTWKDRGNYLRIRLGSSIKTYTQISILETNVDDVNAEILGHAIGQLMSDGALDVSYYPIMMKKNRPAYAIKVICRKEDEMSLADKIMRLTGTLGIRINSVDRHIGSREVKSVRLLIQGKEFDLRLKIGKYRSKIEFDDIIRIANELDLTPRQVQKIVEGMVEDEK